MSGINKIILVGHVGREPELRYLPDNAAVLNFSLDTSEFVIKNGQRIEQTEWHNIVMWRGLAEAAQKVLHKGRLVYLEGKCRTRQYDDRKGAKHHITEIIADQFQLLGRASDFELSDITNKNGQ